MNRSLRTSLLFFLVCSTTLMSGFQYIPAKKPVKRSYTEQNILSRLDSLGYESPYNFYPDLGHGYFALAGSRITLFADKERWAIVFEKTGYNNRGFYTENSVQYYGNCLQNQEIYNQNVVNTNDLVLNDEDLNRVMDRHEFILPGADSISLHHEKFAIEHDPKAYAARQIPLYHDSITIVAMLRLIDETHPGRLRASETELRQCLPPDLPLLMHIDHWHQEPYDFYTFDPVRITSVPSGTPLSRQEAYQLMAKVLVSGDTTLYKPKLPANNDWRFWPGSGGL